VPKTQRAAARRRGRSRQACHGRPDPAGTKVRQTGQPLHKRYGSGSGRIAPAKSGWFPRSLGGPATTRSAILVASARRPLHRLGFLDITDVPPHRRPTFCVRTRFLAFDAVVPSLIQCDRARRRRKELRASAGFLSISHCRRGLPLPVDATLHCLYRCQSFAIGVRERAGAPMVVRRWQAGSRSMAAGARLIAMAAGAKMSGLHLAQACGAVRQFDECCQSRR